MGSLQLGKPRAEGFGVPHGGFGATVPTDGRQAVAPAAEPG